MDFDIAIHIHNFNIKNHLEKENKHLQLPIYQLKKTVYQK
jgi:hypothetical protein